ncbi:MAG: UDP-2,3-diacylglucosamine diphosphatase LpxI [Planctomycetes bacterium]|nr:UDP-2,3-diacylglucosamine diphosphatase LpxI [Planctomycetota bacterium]
MSLASSSASARISKSDAANRTETSLRIYSPSETKRVGIVAGWGEYPIRVAKALKDIREPVVVAAIKGHADASLAELADEMRWFGVCKLGAMQRFFRHQNVDRVVLAGKLFKDRILFHGLGWLQHVPDLECMRTMMRPWFSRNSSMADDSLLGAVVESFERQGMRVMPGTDYATDLLAEEGLLTHASPSRAIRADIEFGWNIAKDMGGLDIGQSISVKDRTVLAVEAVEGTDACIERTGQLCPRGNWTLIKVAKPQQDMRFDLPTIGPQTIERMIAAGGKAIAIEAGMTILVDRDRTLRLANRHGICIISLISTKRSLSER